MLAAADPLDDQRLTYLHIPEETEMCIAVTGDDAIPGVTGQSAGAQMAGTERKRAAGATGQDDKIDRS